MPTGPYHGRSSSLCGDNASPRSYLHDLHLYAWPSEGDDESSASEDANSPSRDAEMTSADVPILRADVIRRPRSRRPSKADELDLCQLATAAGIQDVTSPQCTRAAEGRGKLHDLHLYTWPGEGEDDECEEWRPQGAAEWVRILSLPHVRRTPVSPSPLSSAARPSEGPPPKPVFPSSKSVTAAPSSSSSSSASSSSSVSVRMAQDSCGHGSAKHAAASTSRTLKRDKSRHDAASRKEACSRRAAAIGAAAGGAGHGSRDGPRTSSSSMQGGRRAGKGIRSFQQPSSSTSVEGVVSRFFPPIRFQLSSSSSSSSPSCSTTSSALSSSFQNTYPSCNHVPSSGLTTSSVQQPPATWQSTSPAPISSHSAPSPSWFAQALPAATSAAGSASPQAPRDPFSPQPVNMGPHSPVSEIPDDLLLTIFGKLQPESRPTLGMVCRRWHRMEFRLRERLKLDFGTCYPRTPWQGGGGSHQGFLDFTLERVLPQMPALEHVDITNVVYPQDTPLTDDGLVLLGTWCRKLRTLRLNIASQGLSGRGVTAALLGCGRTLQELELQRCPGVGREALKAIADYCPHLQALSLKNCPLVSDHGLAHFLTARCRLSLRRLNLAQCRNVRDRGLLHVASSFPALTSLDASHCDVTDVGVLSLLAYCPDLSVFSARGCSDLSNVCMKALAATSAQLQELDIRRARWITASGVTAVLRHCSKLRRLCIDDSITTDEVRLLAREQKVELIPVSSQHRSLPMLPWF